MAAIKASAQIGWIGMGKMGLPICKRLHDAGFQVRVLCRNGATESVATTNGFEVARTISETVDGADVVASAISEIDSDEVVVARTAFCPAWRASSPSSARISAFIPGCSTTASTRTPSCAPGWHC